MTELVVKTKNKKVVTAREAKKWYLIDVRDKVLGRVSTRIAKILMGKNKPNWVPFLDMGDYCVVINASKVRVTGNKEEGKIYYRYSGYPGGLKAESLKSLRKRKPEEIIRHAVKGMLPKTKLGRQMIKKLYIYSGEKHPHEAQKPEKVEV